MRMYIHQQQKVGEYGDDNGGLVNLLGLKINNIRAIILQGKEHQYYAQVNYGIKQAVGLAKHIKAEYDDQEHNLCRQDIYILQSDKHIGYVDHCGKNKQYMRYNSPTRSEGQVLEKNNKA